MTTEEVWAIIGQIPVGHIIAWGAVICSIIVALYKTISKLYAFFSKYKSMREENERQAALLKEHDSALEDIGNSLQDIKNSLKEQRDVNLKQIRHTIVHTCDDALDCGFITAGKLRSLEELYEEYLTVFNGNGYVKTLVEKVRELPVQGKLDD